MTTVPEGARLSEDGADQWDGADWQPVQQEGLVLHDLDAYPTEDAAKCLQHSGRFSQAEQVHDETQRLAQELDDLRARAGV
jgi:hypothetical protein